MNASSRVAILSACLAYPLGTAAQTGLVTHRSCSTVAETEVCTWVKMDRGVPVELGASIPVTLADAVPLDAEMTWPPEQLGTVPLPDEARASLGLDRLVINWEAHGHPPATFAVAHFDFHFYNITEEQTHAIDCSDPSKPRRLPSGFALPDIEVPGLGRLTGLCVPNMGMHAMLEPETTRAEGFEASMVVGYYAGRPVFFEPMVSRERLLAREAFELAVPEVYGLPADVHYPRAFRAAFDRETDSYLFVFNGFHVQ